jgi:deoxycytidine triphosphate deaminase
MTVASPAIDLSRLPRSDEEAEELADRWQHEDPFPDIDPALLNTADLFDYVATTGLIYPFRVDPSDPSKALKPASCGIQLAGEVIYWDPDHRDPATRRPAKQKQQLGKDTQVLTLPSNSIVYATLEPTFRLPDYIAARFNLNIYLVYRGLLVGTGPLVDPGFRGRLSLPLHNLTAHPCTIRAGEIVIWMEFTKLSRNDRWHREGGHLQRSGVYVPFPEWKIARGSVGNYLETVHKDEPIISSIPDEIAIAREEAKSASAEATRTRRNAKWFEVGAAFALAIGVITLLGFLWSVDRDLTHDADSAVRRANEVEQVNNRILDEVKALQAQVGALKGATAGP